MVRVVRGCGTKQDRATVFRAGRLPISCFRDREKALRHPLRYSRFYAELCVIAAAFSSSDADRQGKPFYGFGEISPLESKTTVSTCVVAMIGTHSVYLVGCIGTQISALFRSLTILSRRLEVCPVHTILKSGLINKC